MARPSTPPDGALLAVWGTNVDEDDFLPEAKKQISRDEKEGGNSPIGG